MCACDAQDEAGRAGGGGPARALGILAGFAVGVRRAGGPGAVLWDSEREAPTNAAEPGARGSAGCAGFLGGGGGKKVLEETVEIVVGEEIDDDPALLEVLVVRNGDAGTQGSAKLGFEIDNVGGLGAVGGAGGLGASEAVGDDALGHADGEVVALDPGGEATHLGSVGEAEEGSRVAHGECST